MAAAIIIREIGKVRQKNVDAQSQLRAIPVGPNRDLSLEYFNLMIDGLEKVEYAINYLLVYPDVREYLQNNAVTGDHGNEVLNKIYNPLTDCERLLLASNEVIYRFLEVTVTQEHIDTTQECSICLVQLSLNETIYRLPRCFHMFHNECIKQWTKMHNTCPACRASLDLSMTHHAPITNETSDDTKTSYAAIEAIVSKLAEINKFQDDLSVRMRLKLSENTSPFSHPQSV